ncbi:E3 UFM1-protein ligase 1 [Blastocystis sp. subtype 4]|uniref:E3 UFM1-protein ligase 1 n=1 Tax=Blastocystis sp. subtype 4 TaxID=944170 RepID=UPI0007122AC5|nr:E3 UFM1-protein ligase 1 [Blastocystis sp. subtype 4]KNB42560.1 E3 UFM1-protein ligase 1 [Blastocystis sp. subtype 4]|eukprot:XP_014526003.1 E3 UFM1-protein ligase 1 [Blastocystis sp. subtype 4]
MQELEAVQNADVTHNRLFVKGIISSTRSGIREYLTWPELETEILSELDSHDGRVSFLELEEAINVDITYIEKCSQKLLDSDCGIMKLNNQELISERYTEMIVEKCTDIVFTKGIIKIGLLATKFNLPVSYLTTTVIPLICEQNPSICSKNGDLYTIVLLSTFIRRNQCCIRGILLAIDKPALLSELSDFYSIDASLFQETVSTFIKQGQIHGSIKAGSFIPQRYEDQKNDAVVNFLRSNQYVTKKLLKDNRVDIFITSPIEYFTKHGYSKKLTELDSLWISEDLMEDLVATTAELCNEEGFVEIASIFPPSFTSADQMLVLKQIDKIVFQCDETVASKYTVLDEFVVLSSLLSELVNQFLKDMESSIQKVISMKHDFTECVPTETMIESSLEELNYDLTEECVHVIVSAVHNVISSRYESCYKKQKEAILRGESVNRKRDQKEVSASLIDWYHHYESVMKLLDTTQSSSLQNVLGNVEKELKQEGVCLVIHFLQVLNDCPVTPLTTLVTKSTSALREEVKQLSEDTKAFVTELLTCLNGPKKEKGKKNKNKGKKGKEEEIMEEEKSVSFLDCFVKVTDFGGPLFKSYDRKQSRQLLHTGKIGMQEELSMLILQSVNESSILLLARLMMNLKYAIIPYVPSMEMAKALITDYSDTIPEDSKEEYVKLIPLVFGDDKDAMQQAVMDMVKLVIKKFSVYLERKLNE